MELVDMLDLGSSAARRGGSTPFIRTKKAEDTSSAFLFLDATETPLSDRKYDLWLH
jgi:hypothetical protein